MHSLILRYDLIREKCISFNEETQKIYLEVFVMSKIFTWMFGFVSGIIGGMVLLATCVVANPNDFVYILEHLDSNTDRR